ncbi:uncharacterized protein [Glycine max]|uniref:uncharacterized protein n=1 Tax=Glycine max TaxID=3847 RepID=UPI0003DE9B0B|nr:uncharacterized protein LOC102667146 [Glycine max]|eukprot:XP_006576068.1 uncharacterized protein LOC102667146 [Glycine max]
MALNTGSFVTVLPILDGKNWERWCIQMKEILGYQDVMDIVEEGYPSLPERATEAQKAIHKENKKRDCRAMCLLPQCVDIPYFEKIARAATSKEAWDILEKGNAGANQLKKVRLQTMRRQYELMQMEDTEKIADFFNRIIKLTNSMKLCGETITESTIVEKISRTLTLRFDHIVVAIEESGKIESLRIEELQGSLEAHEQRLNERTTERHTDQALQAQTHRRRGSNGRSYNKTRGRGRDPRSNARKAPHQQEPEKHDSEQPESSNGRGGYRQYRGGKKRFDRKRLKCFNCGKIGHFFAEC